MSAADVDLVSREVAAFNAHDPGALCALYHETCLWRTMTSESIVDDSTIHGHEGLRRYLREAKERWSEFRAEVGEFRDLEDGRVLALGRFEATGRLSGVPTSTPCSWMYYIRDGLIDELHNFSGEHDPFDEPSPAVQIRLPNDDAELREALQLRREVFCDEQGVDPEEEFDEQHETALHVVATTRDGSVVGTCRLRVEGESARLGRMAIRRDLREKGLGRKLLLTAEGICRQHGVSLIELHAQVAATRFYEKSGYAPFGPEFLDAGINHIAMKKRMA